MPWGSITRCMFEMAGIVGARISELDDMRYNDQKRCFVAGNYLYWRPGKGQRGWRKEYLPNYYLSELAYMRANNRMLGDRLFPVSSETFASYFNKKVRPLLGSAWNQKTLRAGRYGGKGYLLELKNLRKTWATHTIFLENKKWDDWHTSIEIVSSQRMKHSKTFITVTFYLKNFSQINMVKWGDMEPWQVFSLANQRHIPEFDVNLKALIMENCQSRLADYA